MTEKTTIAVIGAGAAGLMAAGRAAELGADVLLFDRNRKVGKKLAITGKGRCNVTNACDRETLLASVRRNPRFLYSAFSAFMPEDTVTFFESHGVPLKTERGNRVFPVSDQAADVVHALERYASPCRFLPEQPIQAILTENNRVTAVKAGGKTYPCDAVILATGGMSYPLTGSTGDGYRLAEALGHTVIAPEASLVPLETVEPWCAELQGLSLRNIAVRLTDKASGKTVFDDFGEMIFTHFGISGPVILSMSAHIKNGAEYQIGIDLKPALDEQTLDDRLLRDFAKYQNRDFANALSDLLPQKLIPVFVGLCGIPPHTKVNAVTKQMRHTVLSLLKNLPLTFRKKRPIAEAIVTAGGIDVREVSPKTMESKKISGLYFAGEVLDVDAYTGGFNLQIAFSTARLAAENAVCTNE